MTLSDYGIILVNVGLLGDIIGAIFIVNSIFSLKSLRTKLPFPTHPSEEVKKYHKDLEKSKAFNIKQKKDEDIEYLDEVGHILKEAQRILNDRKFAKIGLYFLVSGFILQIIGNNFIFYYSN